MKRICFLPVGSALAAVLLASCGNDSHQLSGDSSFDPFVAPGMQRGGVASASARGFKRGSFVRTIMDNAAFFKQRPSGNADADKLLKANTEMKVISDDQSYVKVEMKNGEIGFVPTVQVADVNDAAAGMGAPLAPIPSVAPGAVQVYPPLPGSPGTAPLPTVKPTPDQPTLPPVIDPDSPATTAPLPPPIPESTTATPPPPAPVPVEKEKTDGQ